MAVMAGMAKWQKEWQNGRMAEMATYILSIPAFNCHSTIPPFRHSAIPCTFMVHADVDTDDTDDDDDDELHANTDDDDDDDNNNDDNGNIAISAILPFYHSFCHSA